MENNEDIEIKNDDSASQSEPDLIEDNDSQEAMKYSTSEYRSESIPLILRNYFQIVSKIVNSKATGKCLFCPGEKTFRVNLKTNGNLVKHLQRVHPPRFREYKMEIKKRAWIKKSKDDHDSSAGARRTKTLNLNQSPTKKQQEFDQKIVNYIMKSGKPLSTVEDQSFVDLFSYNPDLKVMTKSTLMRRIEGEKDLSTDNFYCNSTKPEDEDRSEIEHGDWLNPDILISPKESLQKETHESLQNEGMRLDNEYKKLMIKKIKIEIALMKKRPQKHQQKNKYYSISSNDFSE